MLGRTPYFVWPSEILMKYPFLVRDLSSFILSTCTCIYHFFFFAKETWMTSIPSIWQVSELVAYNINLFSSTEYNWCEYCLPMKSVFFKISTKFYLKGQFSYFSVLFVTLRYCILSLKKKEKKTWEKQLYMHCYYHMVEFDCVCALDHFRDTLEVWSIYLLTAAPLSVPLLTCKFTMNGFME